MNLTDLAEKLALGIYGKTGRVNSPQNNNDYFRAGFAVGCEIEDVMQAISQEWIRIGSPETPPQSFKEWKRGLWAARLQKTVAEMPRK